MITVGSVRPVRSAIPARPARKADEVGKCRLRFKPEDFGLIFLDIDAKRGPRRARAGKPVDHPRAIFKHNADALVGRVGAIDDVVIGKIIGSGHCKCSSFFALQIWQLVAQEFHQFVGSFCINLFIVMAGIIVAAIARPVLLDDIHNALPALGQNIKPQQNSPEAILLAHMVGAGSRAFFTAERDHAGVQEVSEKFPSRGRFKTFDAEFCGNPVHRATCGHGACNTCKSLGVTRRQLRIGGKQRQRIRRRHELVFADDEIAVAITIGCRAEIRAGCRHHQIIKFFRMNQIGIRVMPAEIRKRRSIYNRALGRPKGISPEWHGHRGRLWHAWHQIECENQI